MVALGGIWHQFFERYADWLGGGRQGLPLRDLVEIALAHPTTPELRIEKLFDWYLARETEVMRWALGAASAMVIALLPGMWDANRLYAFDDQDQSPAGRRIAILFAIMAVGMAVLGIVLSAALAGLKYDAIKHRSDLYVPALKIVSTIAAKGP